MLSLKSLYRKDSTQSIQKIIEIAIRDMDDFMYVNFSVYRDDFCVLGCHTSVSGSKLIDWRLK